MSNNEQYPVLDKTPWPIEIIMLTITASLIAAFVLLIVLICKQSITWVEFLLFIIPCLALIVLAIIYIFSGDHKTIVKDGQIVGRNLFGKEKAIMNIAEINRIVYFTTKLELFAILRKGENMPSLFNLKPLVVQATTHSLQLIQQIWDGEIENIDQCSFALKNNSK